MKNNYSSLEKTTIVLLLIGGVILLSTTLLFIFNTSKLSIHSSLDTNIWSNYGSFISGFVGSIFSIATIIIIYITYKSQREELEQTREELVETRKIAEAQEKTMRRQQFENTLFKLFDNHLKIIKSHEVNYPIKDVLTRELNSLIHNTETYKKYIESKCIDQLDYFSYNPLDNPITNSELTFRINEDVLHIGEFIIDQVGFSESEIEFYFRSLFNILFDAEKYFFGYCTFLRISGCESPVSMKINKFNKYFNEISHTFKLFAEEINKFYPSIEVKFSKSNSNKKTVKFNELKDTEVFTFENKSLNKVEILSVRLDEEHNLLEDKLAIQPNHYFEFGNLFEFINKKYFKNELNKLVQKKTLKQTIIQNRIKGNVARVIGLNIKLRGESGEQFEYKCNLQISFGEEEVSELDLYWSS